MEPVFEKTFHVGWAHIDMNGHLGNTSYIDLALDVRMFFFAEHGFPVEEFRRQSFGPVIFKDEMEYYREFHLLDRIRITFQAAGMSEDGSQFRLRNDVFRADGRLAARLTSVGGWLDLERRKLRVPPDGLLATMKDLAPTEDYTILPTVIKK
jgi:acyl-CoA thioester hydrolase